VKDLSTSKDGGDIILGDDWVAPNKAATAELANQRQRRNLFSLRRSPLTRKIVIFNLIALALMFLGIYYSNTTQNSLTIQRSVAIVNEAALVADMVELRLSQDSTTVLDDGTKSMLMQTLDQLNIPSGSEVYVFSPDGETQAVAVSNPAETGGDTGRISDTFLTDGLAKVLSVISAPLTRIRGETPPIEEQLKRAIQDNSEADGSFLSQLNGEGGTVFSAGSPIQVDGQTIGIVALTSGAGEIDRLAREEGERVLQMFVFATIVSIGLSLVLASTIANPIADLSEAAELGRDKNSRKVNPGQIRIPDLTARPDEIGRLSGALRSMVAALYTRIEGNEQFAADVAHEIKNPLASLRSAVGTLRMVKREDQRDKLLDVIDHDVRRLDRLVSDISNASRLDAELVKEEEEPFELLKMLGNLGQYLGEDAKIKGIEFILDIPKESVVVQGLEARLAQVFVNLITNAISFCEDGDAIRVWARKRENRILVVVEDTGPGIPDQALGKIFKRFYSERPEEHFGNNSGLGLAISKQIVEAHGGVIWAENIRPTDADITSEPLGARFVVGLPI